MAALRPGRITILVDDLHSHQPKLALLQGYQARREAFERDHLLRDKMREEESLGQHFKLSKERIRQLEDQALRKMRKRLEGAHGSTVAELI